MTIGKQIPNAAGIGRFTGSLWRTEGVGTSTASCSSDGQLVRRPSRSAIGAVYAVTGMSGPVTDTQVADGTTTCVQGEALLA